MALTKALQYERKKNFFTIGHFRVSEQWKCISWSRLVAWLLTFLHLNSSQYFPPEFDKNIKTGDHNLDSCSTSLLSNIVPFSCRMFRFLVYLKMQQIYLILFLFFSVYVWRFYFKYDNNTSWRCLRRKCTRKHTDRKYRKPHKYTENTQEMSTVRKVSVVWLNQRKSTGGFQRTRKMETNWECSRKFEGKPKS